MPLPLPTSQEAKTMVDPSLSAETTTTAPSSTTKSTESQIDYAPFAFAIPVIAIVVWWIFFRKKEATPEDVLPSYTSSKGNEPMETSTLEARDLPSSTGSVDPIPGRKQKTLEELEREASAQAERMAAKAKADAQLRKERKKQKRIAAQEAMKAAPVRSTDEELVESPPRELASEDSGTASADSTYAKGVGRSNASDASESSGDVSQTTVPATVAINALRMKKQELPRKKNSASPKSEKNATAGFHRFERPREQRREFELPELSYVAKATENASKVELSESTEANIPSNSELLKPSASSKEPRTLKDFIRSQSPSE